MKRQRAHLHVVAPAAATPPPCGLTSKQAALLRSLAAALGMDEQELVRAFLADELPTAKGTGSGGDLAALVAAQPLYVVCGNRQEEAEFHARLERAARYQGLASAEEYVSRLLHLTLWADEREMIIHPQTGAVVGTEAKWSELRRHLDSAKLIELPLPQAEAA